MQVSRHMAETLTCRAVGHEVVSVPATAGAAVWFRPPRVHAADAAGYDISRPLRAPCTAERARERERGMPPKQPGQRTHNAGSRATRRPVPGRHSVLWVSGSRQGADGGEIGRAGR